MKKLFLGIKESLKTVKVGLAGRFVLGSAGKPTLNGKAVLVFTAPAFLVLLVLSSLLSEVEDTSVLENTRYLEDAREVNTEATDTSTKPLKGVTGTNTMREGERALKRKGEQRSRKRPLVSSLKLKATQVIVRSDASSRKNTLPVGTNFIGELLTAIDTRDQAKLIRIRLPYGGSFKGRRLIPKESIIFASSQYSGDGEKVILQIERGIFPDGHEFKIAAQTLDAKDFSVGLRGDYHGTFSNRVGGALALSFISGFSDVLQEKESLGSSGVVTKKSTLRNAMLNGVSDVSKLEGQRQVQGIQSETAYLTVDPGKELIISLIEPFKKDSN